MRIFFSFFAADVMATEVGTVWLSGILPALNNVLLDMGPFNLVLFLLHERLYDLEQLSILC